jgi:hypothetical protein
MTTPGTEPTAAQATPDARLPASSAKGASTPDAAAATAGRPSWLHAILRLRHPGWSWTVGRDWLIPLAAAVTTLFLGAALGGVPALAAGTWQDPQTRIAVWTAVALGAVGLLALIATWFIWRGRSGILQRNGTAYIIQEVARGWSADDNQVFLAEAKRQFARTIDVPGPGKLGGSWDWPLDESARYWDSKVTELVRAFQALRSDDDPLTPKGIFMWAWAPVAIAFGARATAADRGLVLDIWQRPSKARAGELVIQPWSQRPHRFGNGQQPNATGKPPAGIFSDEYQWLTDVTIKPSSASAAAAHSQAAHAEKAPVILLVRLGRQSWGPVPDLPAEPDPAVPLAMTLQDKAGLGIDDTFRTEIREFRVTPPEGGTLFPWADYPPLAAEASRWIRQQAAGLDGHLLLLGTIVPPEVALGLGIHAGQLAGLAWPAHLWPIVAAPVSNALSIPRLDLGRKGFDGLVSF